MPAVCTAFLEARCRPSLRLAQCFRLHKAPCRCSSSRRALFAYPLPILISFSFYRFAGASLRADLFSSYGKNVLEPLALPLVFIYKTEGTLFWLRLRGLLFCITARSAHIFPIERCRRPGCKTPDPFAGKHRQQGMARGSRETCLLPHAPAILTQSAPWQPSGPPWGVFRIFCIRVFGSKKQRAKLYCAAGNGGTRRGRGDSPPPASGISGLIAAADALFHKAAPPFERISACCMRAFHFARPQTPSQCAEINAAARPVQRDKPAGRQYRPRKEELFAAQKGP